MDWELATWLKANRPEQYAYVMELASFGWS